MTVLKFSNVKAPINRIEWAELTEKIITRQIQRTNYPYFSKLPKSIKRTSKFKKFFKRVIYLLQKGAEGEGERLK